VENFSLLFSLLLVKCKISWLLMRLWSNWKANWLSSRGSHYLTSVVLKINRVCDWCWPLILSGWRCLRYFVSHSKLRWLASIRMLSWLRLALSWIVRSARVEAWIQWIIMIPYHVIQAIIIYIARVLSFSLTIIHRIFAVQLYCATWTKKWLMFIMPIRYDSSHHDLTSII